MGSGPRNCTKTQQSCASFVHPPFPLALSRVRNAFVFALSISPNFFVNLVMYLVPMILSLSVHEYAHAWMAWRLGDDTAARQGRLTLNPLSHMDPFGTLLIPGLNVLLGGFALIGWAKPVPVSPVRFHRKVTMRMGMILTAAAGPLSNLILAIVSIGVAALLIRFAPGLLVGDKPTGLIKLLQAMFILNIGLFIFNLLPLPPLDGSRLLPRSMDAFVTSVAPYSFILLLVVINIPLLRTWLLERPVMLTVSVLQSLFQTQLWGGV
jgi:Zn-dependent protease